MTRMPEVIIIYVVGDKAAHAVGANRRPSGEWRFSSWIDMPESELNAFIAEGLESGMSVLDVRLLANLKTPGMGKSTPILMARKGISMVEATKPFEQLHRAILNSPDEAAK